MLAYQSIGVLSPFVEGDYFSLLLSGIREVLRSHHFQLLAFQGTPADLRATRLAYSRVAGWIVIVETEHIQDIAPSGTPLVTVAAVAPEQICPAVLTDNQGGMHAAIQHLCAHGHRRIAFVGSLDQLDFQQRYAGYQAALSEHQLPLDMDLVYVVDSEEELGGRQAAQRMLAAGLPSTAVVTATDEIAIGLMEALQAAGRRIPADVAIVGFDDIDRAQYTNPPLSTVHQPPEALGRTAAALLMHQIAGHDPIVDVTYIPTTFIPRRSCGCAGASSMAALDAAVYQMPDWQDIVTGQLVRRVCSTLPLAAAIPPAAIWPGALILTQGLAAVLADGQLLPPTQIELAWHQAVLLTPDFETLDSVFQELNHAARHQLAALPADSVVHAHVEAFLDRTRRGLMWACLAPERAQLHHFQNSVQSNHAISMRLLGAEMTAAPALAWLAHTSVTGGCLSLWAETPVGVSAALVLAGRYDRDGDTTLRRGSRYDAAIYPPDEILSPSAHADGPDSVLVLPVRTANRAWGLLTICASFTEQFAVENMFIWANLLGVALERAAFLASLTAQQIALRGQQETLRVAYERERELVESIRHDALYDGLTGLPNRSLFLDRLERVIAHAKRYPDYLCAVLFLDLDGFKIVNDSLGHFIGDQLLIGVAERLTTSLRTDDTAARFGGDEFAVLLNDVRDMAYLPDLVDRIQTHLARPFQFNGHDVVVTASIGIAVNLTQYEHVADVLRDADIAMYRAKATGKRTYAIFDTEMHAGVMNRLQIESELRRAIDQQEFELHYQPIMELATGRIVQVEALIRWRHPERGLLAPAAFLAIAEETGLMVPIGRWTFSETCKQIRAWQAAVVTPTPVRMSVNVSHKQFWHPGLIDSIKNALHAHELNPCILCVEITEGVIMSNPEAANKLLQQLHDHGIHLSIDDFGTGYSSLEALHRFPIEALKIDRSFIMRLGIDPRSTELVRTIIMMGQNLGLEVVAEGVETIDQQRSLQALNCRYGQGYLFGRPMSGDDVCALLAQQS